jgi:hypothetical protein
MRPPRKATCVTALSFSYSLLPVVPGQEEEKTPVRFAVEIVQQQTFSSSFFNFFLPPPLSPCSWKWHFKKKKKKKVVPGTLAKDHVVLGTGPA